MNIPDEGWSKVRFLEQFFRHVKPKRKRECWLWNEKNDEHYHLFKFRGTQESAHRVMWRISYGDIPDGRMICHRCDVKSCVNPLHLFCGSALENTGDMIAKERDRMVRERNGRARLSIEQVRTIREEYRAVATSQLSLARKYRVSEATIWYVVNGKTWRGV